MTVCASCRQEGRADDGTGSDASREERDVSVTGEYGVGTADIAAGPLAPTPDSVINARNDYSLTSDADRLKSPDFDISRSADVHVRCSDDCSHLAHDADTLTSRDDDRLSPVDNAMSSKEVYPHHYIRSYLSANLSSRHCTLYSPCKLHLPSDAISCDALITRAKANASSDVSSVPNDLRPEWQSPDDTISPSHAKSRPETGTLGDSLITPLVPAATATVNRGSIHTCVNSQQGSTSAELTGTKGSLKGKTPDDVISSDAANPRSEVSFPDDVISPVFTEPKSKTKTPDCAVLSPRSQISSTSGANLSVSVTPTFQPCSDVSPSVSMTSSPQTSSKAEVHSKRVVRSMSRWVSERPHPCISRLLSHPPDFSAFRTRADDGDLGSEVTKVNLDITTLITLVSSVCHGAGRLFRFPDKVLDQQAAEERTRPVLPDLQKYLDGKRLLVCRTALQDFQSILNLLGGPVERQRAARLLDAIDVVQDQLSERAAGLQAVGKVKDRSKTIFGTGDALQAVTVTANSGFIRAAKNQGVTFAVCLHPARALTEKKEETATPLSQA